MKEDNIEDASCKNTIKVTKLVEKMSSKDDIAKVSVVISVEEDVINVLSEKFKMFLKDNILSGGIMDIKIGKYEFELFFKDQEDTDFNKDRTEKAYMSKFLNLLSEEFTLETDECIKRDLLHFNKDSN